MIKEKSKTKDEGDGFTSSLLKVGILTRLLAWALAVIFDSLIPDHEYSTDIYLATNDTRNNTALYPMPNETHSIQRLLVKPLVRWDAMFFVDTSAKGYEFFKNHPFFPGYSLIVKFLTPLFQFLGSDTLYPTIFSAIFVSHVSFLMALYLLYKMGKEVLKNERVARVSALLFCFSPATVFYISTYSESLYCLLLFGVIYFSIKNERYSYKSSLVAAIICGFLSLIRSNGLFAIIIVGHKLVLKFLEDIFLSKVDVKSRVLSCLKDIAQGISLLVLSLIPYAAYLYYPERIYCNNDSAPEWCGSLYPGWYAYLQNKFWNVGFLQFYQGKNAYFIIIGWIFIPLFLNLIWSFVKKDPLDRLLLGIPGCLGLTNKVEKEPKEAAKKTVKDTDTIYVDENGLTPVYLYTLILVLVLIFIAHVNIAARLLSSNPLVYWFAASQLLKPGVAYKSRYYFTWYQKWILGVFLTGYFLGLVLFSNFFLFV